MDLEQFDYVEAEFRPVSTTDLKPSAAIRVGIRDIFQVVWTIEEGKYAGDLALQTPHAWRNATWVPLCDLADIRPVDSDVAYARLLGD